MLQRPVAPSGRAALTASARPRTQMLRIKIAGPADRLQLDALADVGERTRRFRTHRRQNVQFHFVKRRGTGDAKPGRLG